MEVSAQVGGEYHIPWAHRGKKRLVMPGEGVWKSVRILRRSLVLEFLPA
eukprot:CAMPEP_0182591112 /NCGR_PEP_ID=MMETSP1324-20130603/73056_1 /TAXON_ID=236786 /ORGANISM="Florenciella sp., Strain RCC1587" /LENGTH=48 /DNA_ID= /DNA_START= /DNA_END= /DNA_ORIENTATION=